MFSAVVLLICSSSTLPWVYPEHRDIALLAILKLNTERKAILDQLWAQARKGYESRLNESVIDAGQGVKPQYIDYAAWPGIAGDHSTSSENMVYNILHTNWILEVADITARLKKGIASAKNESEIEAELRNSDIRLLRADPEYVSRAGSNFVHFMLARPGVNTSADDYFESCYKEGAAVNLIGTYKWYHTSAMLKAMRLATETLTPEQKSSLSLAILADEAFALHFLEDGFSAGHVAGIWGNASQRKGTHDYYDENGLEVTTWKGERMVLMGDAYMRSQDAEVAAKAVLLSLEQILDAASGKFKIDVVNDQPGVFTPDTFNIAKAMTMPARNTDPSLKKLYDTVLVNTPVPGLSTGKGEIPRFRSEIGPFIGIAPAASSSFIPGGFGMDQTAKGVVSGLEFAVHLGLGTDGVINKSGDGLIFLDLGWRVDGASTVKIAADPAYSQFGSILSAIPSRETFYFRFRMPFYLIPGDLLILGPGLLIFSPKTLNTVVATASQGGLIPWQTGLITPIGRFQFMLGREIGVYFYGTGNTHDAFLIPDPRSTIGDLALISLRSTRLDFPFLEYRPVRSFSRKQSANLFLQLNAGVDIPGKAVMKTNPELPPMDLKSIWYLGVRLGFDWRYYYSRNK